MTTKKEAGERATLTDNLKQRGIFESAQANKWHIVSDHTFYPTHWQYPTYDLDGNVIGTRQKFLNWERKYGWYPSKPDHDLYEWYILPTAQAAIKQADGIAYLSNGEPASLTLFAASLYNNISTTLSEISVPSNLITILERLGVKELRYLMDSDDAGAKSAIKWRDALLSSDIEFRAYKFPERLGDKADANDLWIDCEFDIARMQDAMANLERAILPQPEVKQPVSFEGKFDNEGLVKELQSALAPHFTGKRIGDWLQLICIHHEDRHASAGFNVQTGVINCFACGSHSPNENADILGIDWKNYLPERTKPATPHSTAPKENTEQTQSKIVKLPTQTKPVDTRSYEQVIDDEIMGREMAYESGQYVSWFIEKHLRISVVSAVMTLAVTRSSLPVVFGKMHDAMISGRLKSYFTIDDIVKVTKQSRSSVNSALGFLLQWGFVRFLRTHSSIYKDSIYKDIVPKETTQNLEGGRPSQIFAIETDSTLLLNILKDMISIHYEQKYFRRAISERNGLIAHQLGINVDEYLPFAGRAKSAQDDKDNKAASKAYRKEMYGDGKDWRGWHYALQSTKTIPIDWQSITSCKDLRGQVLKYWIDNVREINSRDELQRLLGCSDPVVDSTLASIDYTSDKQTSDLNFVGKDIPDTVRGMRSIFNDNQRQLRGKCFVISYKIKQAEDWMPAKWQTSSETFNTKHRQPQYLVDCADNLGRIEEIFMKIITPSMQRPMTENELIERDEKLTQETVPSEAIEASEANAQTPEILDDDTSDNEPEIITEPSIQKAQDRYEYKHLFNQIRLEVHCFTEYRLLPSMRIVKPHDDIGCSELVQSFSDLGDVVRYLNKTASDKPLRTVKTFYGDDYDELADIADIEAYALNRLEKRQVDKVIEQPQVKQSEQLELRIEAKSDRPISETERKRRETMRLLRSKSYAEYMKLKQAEGVAS